MNERFPAVPDLTNCLRQLLAQVPAGRVTTCGDLADAPGNRIAAKWVGHWALHHEHDAACTCHRILRAGGELGGYIGTSTARRVGQAKRSPTSGGEDVGGTAPGLFHPTAAKRRRLKAEGVAVRQGTVDLDRFGFRGLVSGRPLERLREIQEVTQRRIILRPRRRISKLVGGVDVAYPSPDVGVAAYALVETATGRLVWSATVRRRVAFPYISTYLSFREIPIYLDLLDEVRAAGRISEVLLVDGSGILHHRHAGVASHLGVAAAAPTVGVTKKLLCGRVDIEGMTPGESRPMVYEDRLVGVALRPTAGSRRPIFISPGHRVDVAFSEELIRRLLTGRRLPEPLYWADRLSKSSR